VNFGTPVPLLIGIVLILGAVALFFLDKIKPGYGRDTDKVYAVLWLICGVFLLGHLTMELLASFQQMLLVGMLIALTIENVLSRKPKADRYAAQGAADGPMPSEPPYRPSRAPGYRSPRMNVRAELEDERAYQGRIAGDRRMLGGRDEGNRGDGYYRDDYPREGGYPSRYDDEPGYEARPATPSERSVGRLTPSNDRIRRRRPKTVDSRYGAGAAESSWDDRASRYPSNTGGYSGHAPSTQPTYPRNGADADSYVDYRPVDYPSDESPRPSGDYGSRY